jgi:hypothetical protein
LTPEQVRELARACYPAVLRQLTAKGAQRQDDVIAFVHPNARSRQTSPDATHREL